MFEEVIFAEQFRKEHREKGKTVKILGSDIECKMEDFKLFTDDRLTIIGRVTKHIDKGFGITEKVVVEVPHQGFVAKMGAKRYDVTDKMLVIR